VDWCLKSSSSTFWGCLFGTWFSTQFRECNFVNYRKFITFGQLLSIWSYYYYYYFQFSSGNQFISIFTLKFDNTQNTKVENS
jgi:hypothetical protein